MVPVRLRRAWAVCSLPPLASSPPDSIEWLQKHVLGEVTDVKSVLFYALAFLLATLLTAAKPTARARLPLYLLLLLLVATERRARLAGMQDAPRSAGGVHGTLMGRAVARFWLSHGRKLAAAAALVVLLAALPRTGRRGRAERALLRLEERASSSERAVSRIAEMVAARGEGTSGGECSELLAHVELLVGRGACPLLEWRPEFDGDDEGDDEYVPEDCSDEDSGEDGSRW